MTRAPRCPYCKTGTISRTHHGDYPGDYDDWCSTPDCAFNEAPQERADERWADYLADTWVDDDGERHYY